MTLSYIIKGLELKTEYDVKVSKQSKVKDNIDIKFGCCFKISFFKSSAIVCGNFV